MSNGTDASGGQVGPLVELVNERPNSVEISVNAKGDVSYKLKVYEDRPEDALTKVQQLKAQMDSWIEAEKKESA